MQVEKLKSKIDIKPLKFTLGETPHATIEPNRTCNLHCRSCYTLNKDYVKSLNDVKREIDLAAKKRNLETISLLGGEPTLHPQIMEIIKFIKGKKIKCQLLTNGNTLLNDGNDRFLDKLIQARVDRILLHVDIGQKHTHKDIDEVRNILFSKLEKKKVHFALSITIYEENKGEIPESVRQYSKFQFFDGILAVLARDPLHQQVHNTELFDEYISIYHKLILEPVAYIPSNLDDKHMSWLIYVYFINANTGNTFSVSHVLDRIIRKLYRSIKGHHLFAIIVNPLVYAALYLLVGLFEIVHSPKKIPIFFKLLKNSNMMRSVRFHFIVIQTPPEFNQEKNKYQICYHCPDATIRNGMLTPVCIADKVNPLNDGSQKDEIQKDLYNVVYKHLEEI